MPCRSPSVWSDSAINESNFRLCVHHVLRDERFLWALPPALPWHSHSIKSENGRFYARVDAKSEVTTIKEARPWRLDRKLWSMKGYLEWAVVANDGSFVFTSSHVVPLPFDPKTEVLWVYLPNGVKYTFTLGQFVKSPSALRPAMSAASWRGATGEVHGDWIVIKPYEGRTRYVNAKTGLVKTSMDAPVP